MEILVKNRSFGQKSKVWSKIEVLVKNRKFGQKLKFSTKIEILVKNRMFGQKSKVWSKIEVLVKNRKFGQKLKFWSKIESLVKNRIFSTLVKGTGHWPAAYAGWAAVDATPQEESMEISQCGPAPLKAIKNGEIYIGYDTGFIFSEVLTPFFSGEGSGILESYNLVSLKERKTVSQIYYQKEPHKCGYFCTPIFGYTTFLTKKFCIVLHQNFCIQFFITPIFFTSNFKI